MSAREGDRKHYYIKEEGLLNLYMLVLILGNYIPKSHHRCLASFSRVTRVGNPNAPCRTGAPIPEAIMDRIQIHPIKYKTNMQELNVTLCIYPPLFFDINFVL